VPHDSVFRVGERRTFGNATLDKIEVAVLGEGVVEAPNPSEELAAEEKVRRLGCPLTNLTFVVLERVDVEDRPDRATGWR
jgi:hypothetical protein